MQQSRHALSCIECGLRKTPRIVWEGIDKYECPVNCKEGGQFRFGYYRYW